ncbi:MULTISPECIES: hypothetical protein [unclassified Streptomyces]|uniref:hypothetical protein n=1 Tax=unclassified Streptomyces TaxID=2593676 RepID=UPI002E166508|nr:MULTISPECIES: hypothetical protein [unclassified Streptomyces]WSJ24685.1 hypothetical protein OG384_23260 [Streptomyces sp. NBC_01324]
MPTSESDLRPPRAVTMTELLAAGAAASAVSTPPDEAAPAPREGEAVSSPSGASSPSGD